MPDRSCEAVELPTHDDIDATSMNSGQKNVEHWPSFLGAAVALIHILADDVPASLLSNPPQFLQLQSGVLLSC